MSHSTGIDNWVFIGNSDWSGPIIVREIKDEKIKQEIEIDGSVLLELFGQILNRSKINEFEDMTGLQTLSHFNINT